MTPSSTTTRDPREWTVRVVRHRDGSSCLTRIPTALAWVLRRRWLTPEDLQ